MMILETDNFPMPKTSFLSKKRGLVLFFFFCFFFSEAKPTGQFKTTAVQSIPLPSLVEDRTEQRNAPSLTIYWSKNNVPVKQGVYSFSIAAPIDFSFMAIGWETIDYQIESSDFLIRYRTRSHKNKWTEWISSSGKLGPDDTPSRLFWSDVLFIMDSVGHSECEFQLIVPEDITLSQVRLDLVGIEKEDRERTKNKALSFWPDSKQGCALPEIITREGWCGSYPDCPVPVYQPVPVQASHVIIHHGGSPNRYADGTTIVRSYWNYHVYSNGWADIGYNFLIDKKGLIYQGRHNYDLLHTDVKGSHAGSSNGQSIGICLLGNTDSIPVTETQLLNLERLLAWWFQTRGFDPTSKAEIIDQAGEKKLYLPRIIGHRDVKTATICPGNISYELLPLLRKETKEQLIACSGNLPQYDISIVAANTGNTNYIAGDSITVQYSLSLDDVIQKTNNEEIPTSFWLSADSIFNPNHDMLMGQKKSNHSETAAGQYTELVLLATDSALLGGKYYLFFVADYLNQVYEPDETNNEAFVPLKIERLNFDIVASANPDKGLLNQGGGRFNFGETCTLKAEANFSYDFLGWFENERLVSTESSYSFKVSKERTLKAEFACKKEPEKIQISGDTQVCSGQTGTVYELKNATNAIAYHWTLPEGATGSGLGHSISVNFGKGAQSGHVMVSIETGCFGTLQATLPLTIKQTPAPPSIQLNFGVIRANDNQGIRWFWDHDIVKGASGQYYLPSGKGIFYAIREWEGCRSLPSNSVEYDPAETSDNENPFYFNAFPNPASENIEVILSKTIETRSRLEISDFNGKVVKRIDNPVGTRLLKVNLTGYPAGIYLMRIIAGRNEVSAKILITNK